MGLSVERLSDISTAWTLLRSAHAGSPDEAAAARELLWLRYGGAVRRYLASALHDPRDAEDLAQEFGLALVRGDFYRADPSRGRFRDYVKTVLFRLVSDHRRQMAKRETTGAARNLNELTAPPVDSVDSFRQEWRDELLARAWAALEESQPDYHRVLRIRADHPQMSSGEMAAVLTEQLDHSLTAAGVRQMLRRARRQFAVLLFDEAAHSLEAPTPDDVAEELADLDLLGYCESFLRRER